LNMPETAATFLRVTKYTLHSQAFILLDDAFFSTKFR